MPNDPQSVPTACGVFKLKQLRSTEKTNQFLLLTATLGQPASPSSAILEKQSFWKAP
jgi:hypothetical protein